MLFAVKGTPTVDGKKDAAWNNALAISSDPLSEKYYADAFFKSPSVDFYLMWDENNLYILEDRRNESIENTTSTSPNGWSSYDCTTYNLLLPTAAKNAEKLAGAMQVSTTPTVTSSTTVGGTQAAKAWGRSMQIYVNTTENRLDASKNWLYSPSKSDIQSVSTKTESGYMIETSVSWDFLGQYNQDDFDGMINQIIGLKIYNNAGAGGARYHYNEGNLAYTNSSNTESNTKDFEGYAQVQLVGSINPDFSWFNAANHEFYLDDAADLLGLSYLTRYYEAYKNTYGFTSAASVTKGNTFYLTSDIDLNPGWKVGESGTNLTTFYGIATMYGIFDGQGHTVSGLYNNGTMPDLITSDYGFIGSLHSGGKVCNLILKNGYLKSDSTSGLGSVVGCMKGGSCTIENVYSDVTVDGTAKNGNIVGGLVGGTWATGLANPLTIKQAVYAGTVIGNTGGTGGIIGRVWSDGNVEMFNCLFAGTVQADSDKGEIVGNPVSGSTISQTNVLSKNAENSAVLTNEVAFKVAYPDCDWALVTGVSIMPLQVSEMLNSNVYIQCSDTYVAADVSNQTLISVRILNVVSSLNWKDIGFEVTVVKTNGTSVTQIYNTDTVYTTITAAGETVSAEELGGKYIYGLVIKNIPTDDAVKLRVTPLKATQKDGILRGITVEAVLKQGDVEKKEATWQGTVPTLSGGTLCGTHMPDAYSQTAVYTNVTKDEYTAYLTELASEGFFKVQDYQLDANSYTLLKGAQATVYVSYLAKTSTARVYSEVAGLNNYPEISTANNYEQGYAKFWQLSVDCLGAKANGGMSYLFQAVDGTFIVIDGGYNTEAEADNLYKLMKDNTTSGEPVIAAWYISHLHTDHFGGFYAFSEKYSNKVDVQSFYYHFDYAGSTNTTKPVLMQAMNRGLWDDAVHYGRLHTGMNFSIKGIKFEVFYTLEDLYPTTAASYNFNSTSSVIRATVGASKRTIIFLADIQYEASDAITANFTATSLKSDIVQYSHHGYEGPRQVLYGLIQAPMVLWPMNVVGNQETGYGTEIPQNVFKHWYLDTQTGTTLADGTKYQISNQYICQSATYVKQIIVSGMGTQEIDLESFAPAKYTYVDRYDVDQDGNTTETITTVIPDFNAYYEAHKSEGNV